MGDDRSRRDEFEAAAEEAGAQSLIGEFVAFLGENRKWWLAPILIALLLLGALIALSATGAAPWIYTLF